LIFLLDEFGGLPRHDPARCVGMLRRDLPGAPFLAPDVDGEDPEAAAARYGRMIDDGGLDLAVVGLGRNGHLGMNEPGSSPLSETRVVDLARSTSTGALRYGATIEPRWGITVGLRQLMEARELWLVVTGGHKSDILRQALGDPIGPDLPATFLREHRNAWLLADSAAMSH
jgi:6-phosphogluconolactonase/glucosamine-6-phosphate isomerase/deaminase